MSKLTDNQMRLLRSFLAGPCDPVEVAVRAREFGFATQYHARNGLDRLVADGLVVLADHQARITARGRAAVEGADAAAPVQRYVPDRLHCRPLSGWERRLRLQAELAWLTRKPEGSRG